MTNSNITQVKQRFGIIGTSAKLDQALDTALQIAPTDLSVLIMGESGVGKERFPQIIHQYSHRKHGPYFAINCGSIPEGTIDSELFGHEKGSFTGATEKRKGYFEAADGGTLFLDEVGELPLSTQARLLRVLETGEFIKVGSSKIEKCDVRVVAATNVNMIKAVESGKFREDLYYRLNSVPIRIPPLRERQEDIALLFKKFATDCAEKYVMPAVKLTDEAEEVVKNYRWPGNVRQLKNITEQISIIEKERIISAEIVEKYLPQQEIGMLPVPLNEVKDSEYKSFTNERELIYQLIFEMRNEISELKSIVGSLLEERDHASGGQAFAHNLITGDSTTISIPSSRKRRDFSTAAPLKRSNMTNIEDATDIEDMVSIEEKEKEMIIQALEKNRGRKAAAAEELGISQRTLYRKIKDYDLE